MSSSSSSPVLKVMEFHRFLAMGLGFVMVFFPTPMHCGCLSRQLSHYEILTFQMWGFFVFFLAHALHTCVVLGTPALRYRMGLGLCEMFTCGSGLYLFEYIFHNDHEPTIAILYVIVFGSLALLYGIAIVNEEKEKEKEKEQEPPGKKEA